MMAIDDRIREQALQWFAALRKEEADEESWLSFCDWLEADDRHRAAYDAVEAAWIEIEAQPATAADHAGAAVIPLRAVRPARPAAYWRQALAIAAVLVLTVSVWLVYRPVAFTDYATGDQPRTIVMADGSSIYMNRHSELSVSSDPRTRRVRLEDGEVAFDVRHDASRPFTVESHGREVRVLGTAFNVLSHGARFEVAVERGVVEVDLPRRAPTRLEAGRKLAQRNQAPATVSTVPSDQALAWRNGVLVYQDSALTEVADDLSRYFDKPVTLDPAAASLRFTGVLQLGDETTMLKQLQDFIPVRVNRSSTDIALSGRAPG